MATSTTSSIAYFFGLLILVHSGYSSFEFHQWTKSSIHESSHLLPFDIVIESIIGILVIVVGAVKSIENEPSYTIDGKKVDDPDSILKDVQINEKVYTSDKYLKPIEMKKAVEVIEKIGLSDYEVFETRVEFIDILAKRKEYLDWIEQS